MFAPASRSMPQTKDESLFYRGPSGHNRRFDVLYDRDNGDRAIRVFVAPGRQRVFLEVRLHKTTGRPDAEELRAILSGAAGVAHGVDDEAVAFAILLLDEGALRVGPLQVAAGRPARRGRDGGLDFLVAPSSEEARYQTDTAGRIDYRQTNLIENARRGDAVAILRAPTDGEPGLDVFGRTVPAEAGAPFHLGGLRNVHVEEETGRCVAEIDGRVVCEDRVLSVVDTYDVQGDVDLHVGDIDFIGHVHVSGQVLDGFTVRGRRGVVVEGAAGACRIWSHGPVVLRGGMNGKGEGRVVSETGGVEARYLTETRVEAEGDVAVKREILNAEVSTHGGVRIPDGAVVGGSVTALGGMEAQRIGSDLGVTTRITAGVDWKAEERAEWLRKRLEWMGEGVDRLGALLTPFSARGNRGRVRRLAPERRALLKEALDRLRSLREERARLQAESDALAERKAAPGGVAQINASRVVHPGAVLQVGDASVRVRDPLIGPVSLLPDAAGHKVRAASFLPLPAPDADREENEEANPRGGGLSA